MFCARSSTWHQPRRPLPVRSAADALELVALAMSRPPRPETIAFILDVGGFGTSVLIVGGTEHADDVLHVVEQVTDAAEVAGAASIVVATVRPAPAPAHEEATLTDDDVDRWLEASDIADDHGIELLEWYIVGPSGIVCPRETFGEPPRWPPH
jgi:hypothetical protein